MSNRVTDVRTGPVVQAGQTGDIHFHPAGPTPTAPRQLASVTRLFTDREHDAVALDRLLDHQLEGTAPVIVITVPGGIGKSALAARWGRRHAERYPDGQLLVHLRADSDCDPAPATETARSLLIGLGTERKQLPWQAADLQALCRSVAATRRLLVVLEDAATAEQVIPLVPANADCLAVVTSRSPMPALAAHGAHHHYLAPLTPTHSARPLARILGNDRVRAEPDAAKALTRVCEGNPPALSLAAEISRRTAALCSTGARRRQRVRPRRPHRRNRRRGQPGGAHRRQLRLHLRPRTIGVH
ncbi:hypothetical protein [Kitasatospora sp. NPDC054795]